MLVQEAIKLGLFTQPEAATTPEAKPDVIVIEKKKRGRKSKKQGDK